MLNTGNNLEKECLWYSFSDILQQDLNLVRLHWNTHYIRKSRFDTISGRPDKLYFLPDSVGAVDHKKVVDNVSFEEMSQYCHGYEEENMYQEYFAMISQQLGLVKPMNKWRDALSMYQTLCEVGKGNH